MIRQVEFKSFDGIGLRGILTVPMQPRAALLMMHGIPSEKDEWGFYSDMAAFFAERSIASLRFDFRGCGESDQSPLCALTLSAMICDIDAAYWQLRHEIGDSVPIHTVGTSAGGGVTVRWHNLLRRSIAKTHLMAPVLDYEFEVTGARRSVAQSSPSSLSADLARKLVETGGLNDDIGYGRAMLHEAHLFDGARELRRASAPIAIYQGAEDSIVPIALTRSIMGDLPIKLFVVDGADHGFAVPGDDDLTDPGTKANHRLVYAEMIERL